MWMGTHDETRTSNNTDIVDVARRSGDNSTTNTTATIGGDDRKQMDTSSPNAILHIGPHKTGTTTIQIFTQALVDELREDGYEMPWVQVPGSRRNVAQLAHCFYKNNNDNDSKFIHEMYPCDERLIQAARNIAMRKSNILLSAEAFDRPELNMTSLKQFLMPWKNVTVVFTYRRFYSWLQSYHNQVTKHRTGGDLLMEAFRTNTTEYLRINITDYLSQELASVTNYIDSYQSVFRYKREYSNVVILNIEDKTNDDVARRFFCHAIPNLEKTCTAVKTRVDRKSEKHNKFKVLTYHDLAYHAHRLGLIHISSKKQVEMAVQLITQHQKVTLKLSDYDFDMICPDRTMLDQLLEISLEMERLMVPEFFASPSGESQLRSDFEKQAKSSLCSIDLTGTIESSNWKGFFVSLNDTLNSIKG